MFWEYGLFSIKNDKKYLIFCGSEGVVVKLYEELRTKARADGLYPEPKYEIHPIRGGVA